MIQRPWLTTVPWALLPVVLGFWVVLATGCGPSGSGSEPLTIVYQSRPGGDLSLDLFLPAETPDAAAGSTTASALRPAVVLIHGGGFSAGDRSELQDWAKTFTAHGYVAVCIDYRLVTSTGDNRFPAGLEDCRQAVRWLRQSAAGYRIDPHRITAFGFSAGGNLALLLGAGEPGAREPAAKETAEAASRSASTVAVAASADATAPVSSRPDAVIDLSGTTDFTVPMPAIQADVERYAGRDPAGLRAASPLHAVAADMVPTLLIHGTRDDVVPIDQAHRLAIQLKTLAVPVELLELPDEGHGIRSRANRERAERVLFAFLDRHLAH